MLSRRTGKIPGRTYGYSFVYTASHDLKSPILNIEGLLKALERQVSKQTGESKNVQPIYELLYGALARFKSTIRDLTEVARVSKEAQEDIASIHLAGVLGEVRQDLAPQIAEADARIDEQLDCSPVYFSKKNLKSVLHNLLSNAVKYRSPDRLLYIRITVLRTGNPPRAYGGRQRDRHGHAARRQDIRSLQAPAQPRGRHWHWPVH